jgi:hypothetical protein
MFRSWRHLLLLLALGCSGPAVSPSPPVTPPAQQPASPALELPPWTAVNIGCGFLLAVNEGETSFNLVLAGDKAQQSKADPSVFLLDGVLVETAVVTAAQMGARALRGHDLLRHQMTWEAGVIAGRRGWPDLRPSGEQIDLGLGSDVKTWYWGLDAPEPFDVEGIPVNRVAYLTAAIDDVVLTLASPLRPEDDPAPAARVVSRAMRSLRRTPSPVDVFAIREAVVADKLDPAFCARAGQP